MDAAPTILSTILKPVADAAALPIPTIPLPLK